MKRFFVAAAIAASIWLSTQGLAYRSAGELLPPSPPPPNPAAEQGLIKPSSKTPSKHSNKTLQAFASDAELTRYLHEIAEKRKQLAQSAAKKSAGSVGGVPSGAIGAALGSLQFSAAPPTASPAAAESVTNVQHAGVDEGGIVKVYGDYLVILRRGRLFTVSIANGALTPVSSANAFGPDLNPANTWYDEMLVANGTVAVIGYSEERGGTEVGLFSIDPAGKLSYRSTHQLRSNDYYSSRNYASRLIGNKLIFYAPLYLASDVKSSVPAERRWRRGAGEADFRRIAFPADIYRQDGPADPQVSTLHTVTVCDLSRGDFDCKATSVLGPAGRVFYVSPHAVYVWVSDCGCQAKTWQSKSTLYRMPLDGSAPSALRVSGSPVDQFSFLEGEDGHLNVLVRSDAEGDGMWGAETAAGSMALLRVPLSRFSDGTAAARAADYLALPSPKGGDFQNRFVGDYLLFGLGNGWGFPQEKSASLYALRYARGDLQELTLTHVVDRIEPMGRDAIIVGAKGTDLHFTAVRLGRSPEIVDDYVRPHASQGELRSHGFFYRPDTDAVDSGMFGLPIAEAGRPGYAHVLENSAAILFVKNESLHFNEMGELTSASAEMPNDGCRASCVDWYGNARPLFVHGRVIALLGYELVEGRVNGRTISEKRRVDYSPQTWPGGDERDVPLAPTSR